MTYEEAKALTSFKNYCNCGGFASLMNGRNPKDPHMNWCPQREEFMQWVAAMDSGKESNIK